MGADMVKATFMKTEKTPYGRMNFYRLEAPIEVLSHIFETQMRVDHVVVSSIKLAHPLGRILDSFLDPVLGTDSSSGTQTMIFSCSESGEIDYGDSLARFNPIVPDAEALRSIGVEYKKRTA
jgi:hypothetical protein